MPRRPADKPSRPASLLALRVDDVRPRVGCGEDPVKRCAGDTVHVSATVIAEGQKIVRAAVQYRRQGKRQWQRARMEPVPEVPDRFAASFTVSELGLWEFRIDAWTDPFAQWQDELRRRLGGGGRGLGSGLAEGALLAGRSIESAADALAMEVDVRLNETVTARAYLVDVDPVLARFGAWFELFPRSFGGLTGVEQALPRLAELGFDVL